MNIYSNLSHLAHVFVTPPFALEILSTYTATYVIDAIHFVFEQFVPILIVFITNTAIVMFLLFMTIESFLGHKATGTFFICTWEVALIFDGSLKPCRNPSYRTIDSPSY